ncbi:hypothetical protein D4764_19G0006040 [Takifugu flavidus]|uniref:Uncharacterized protein n=1 Tax=Takifugu flavidus TaxID=433684 RepID=A0A5C6NP38_9TELE|nr:hypothetical protein D4764_19G0006040 [Takifugu flavidus]
MRDGTKCGSLLPKPDVARLKEDETNGLFQKAASFQGKHGKMKRRKVLKDDRVWFHPPEVPGVVGKTVPLADSFFRSHLFLETSRCVALQPAVSQSCGYSLRAGLPDMADSLSDSQHIERHVT